MSATLHQPEGFYEVSDSSRGGQQGNVRTCRYSFNIKRDKLSASDLQLQMQDATPSTAARPPMMLTTNNVGFWVLGYVVSL